MRVKNEVLMKSIRMNKFSDAKTLGVNKMPPETSLYNLFLKTKTISGQVFRRAEANPLDVPGHLSFKWLPFHMNSNILQRTRVHSS